MRSHALKSSNDGGFEAGRNPLLEAPEPVLEEAPAGLDRAQVRRVRRQKEKSSLRTFHQVANFGRVMGTKVVEYYDVTGVEPGNESAANEADELGAVDGAIEGLVREDAVVANRADDADVFAPVRGPVVDHPLAARSATIGRGHGDVAARLVDEDQPVRRDARYFLDKGDALFFDVLAEELRGPETLFFRVTSARWRARNMLERLSLPPWSSTQASFSWSSVASGSLATNRSNFGSCSSEIRGGNPPPGASGATCPRARWRLRSRETVASPTPNLCANSKYVPSPRSYAATTRRLRSNDSEFIGRHRSDSPDLFKREAV